MNFSNESAESILKHGDRIGCINQFPNNDADHYTSIGINWEVREWILTTRAGIQIKEEISTCILERPSNKFLTNIGHIELYTNTPKPKISKITCHDNIIICGYDDGLILVWSQSTQKQILTNELIDNEGLNLINDLNNKPIQKTYINIFNLDYVFIGHTQKIIELFYLSSKKYLISTCKEGVVKIFDMQNGISIYHFNTDTIINKIIDYIDNKKNEILLMLCKDAFRISLNISKQPFNFTSSSFSHNNIFSYEIVNKNYFCVSEKGNVLIFDPYFNLINEITSEEFKGSFLFIKKWNNYFALFSEDGFLHLSDVNEKTKQIVDLFKMKIGKDAPTSVQVDKSGNGFIIGNSDRNVYTINLQDEFTLYTNRIRMKEEEKDSIVYNNFMKSKGLKKKKPTSSKIKGKSKEKPSTTDSKKGEKSEIGEKPKSSKKRSESASSKKSDTKKNGDKADLPQIKEEIKKKENSAKKSTKNTSKK